MVNVKGEKIMISKISANDGLSKRNQNIRFGSVNVLLEHTGALYGKGSIAEQSFHVVTEKLSEKFPGVIVELKANPSDPYPNLQGIVTAPIHWALKQKDKFDTEISKLFESINIFRGKTSLSKNIEINGLSEAVSEIDSLKI